MKILTKEKEMLTCSWIELSTIVVNYVIAVARHELNTQSEAIEPKAMKTKPSKQQVINYDKTRNAYRARRSDGKQKYFRVDKMDDAEQQAVKWLDEEVGSPSEAAASAPSAS